MARKKHNSKHSQSWHKYFGIGLIILISLFCLTTTSISIFEKISLLFCLAFYLLGYYLAHRHSKSKLPQKQVKSQISKKQSENTKIIATVKYPLLVPTAQCALCGKNLYHCQLRLKFKNLSYICEDCMLKHNFPLTSRSINWAAKHTTDDFKRYINNGQSFTNIAFKKSPKYWYERFWVWLLILLALILYLLGTSETFSIKIFVSFCSIFGVSKLFISDKKVNEEIEKKNNSSCALCGQDLSQETRFLKFKNSTYICKNCMLKYKFSPISKSRAWAASHTIEDLKKYLDNNQDFSDIILTTDNKPVAPKFRNEQLHKPWYKRLEIWLFIITAFTVYLTASSINIFIRIIVALLAAFFVCGARISSKTDYDILTEKIDKQCGLCSQDLYYSDKFVKLKDSSYICQDCMANYKYESVKNVSDWIASHTIDDLKEYIDKGQDFTDISLEIQIQKDEKDEYIKAFKNKSIRYSHYYFNIDARKIYIAKTLLFPDRLVDASEIVSYHINEKKHIETEKYFVTQYFINNVPMGVTKYETKKYLDHLGLVITLTDNSEFEIKFLIVKSEIPCARVNSAYSQLEHVTSILDTWQDHEIDKKQINDIMKELVNYKALLEADIITKEDFDAKKKQLLNL
ncbi:SHOCT domain-containing protein [Lactobacillus sp. ESL0731]|uniref:SHOCT domain-containing protein n=1 Tax=unclassified Lactobacillus TaxID=2620435 RepID=UPI0023F941D6|nr:MULTISPECIES: SHOCT domain-containing protein [unclassified Lactobacillus]WEV51695.1 SHOCT domain-containing protein [Lactobacillus sp. ESL0700]WEV62824.1 SHOCT domain-containing protein [Lactobacillus sp. ESL0731]